MIRNATPDDRFAVLRLAREFLAASGLPLPWDAAYANATAGAYIADADKLCLVLVSGVAVRGVLAAHAAPHPMAPVRFAMELMWWIDPAHRGRGALAMLDAYEAWAAGQGCAFAGLAFLADPRLRRLYERRGYAAAESHFLKVL